MAIFNSLVGLPEGGHNGRACHGHHGHQAVVALAAPHSERAQMACQLAGKKGWHLKPGNKMWLNDAKYIYYGKMYVYIHIYIYVCICTT